MNRINTAYIFKRTIRIVTLYLLIYSLGVATLFYFLHTQSIDKSLAKEHTQFHKSITVIIDEEVKRDIDYMKNIERFTSLKRLIKEHKREELYTTLLPYYQQMQEQNPYIGVMQIHLANGLSFLRMHQKEAFGDDIAKRRSFLQEVHKKHQLIVGYEAGLYATPYRIIMPLFDDEELYIGAIEIGLDPNYFIERFEESTGVQGALFVKKSKIFSRSGELLFDEYYLLSKLSADGRELASKYDRKSRECQSHYFDGKKYKIHYVSLRGSEAFLLLFEDITIFHEMFLNMIIILGLVFVISLPLLLSLLWYQFKLFSNALSRTYEHYINKEKRVQERLDSVVTIVNDGFYDWDIKANTIFYSAQWKETLGYKESELESRFSLWEELTQEDDYKRVMEILEEYLQGEKSSFSTVIRMRHKEGHWRYILTRGVIVERSRGGKPVRLIGTNTDITELRQVKEAYIKSEERLKEAQSIGHIGHWEYSATKSKLLCSDEIFRIVGLEPQSVDVEFSTLLSFVHPEDRREVKRSYINSIRERGFYNITHRIILQDGQERYLEGRGRHTFDGDRVLSTLGTLQDITEKVQIVQRLKQQEQLLFRQSRHAAMGEMISMIAHQWRQPLTVISMIANNIILDLVMDIYSKEELEKSANEIIAMTQQLSKIIDDFRHFSEPEDKSSLFVVESVISETMSIIKRTLESCGIDISIECDSSIELIGDSRELMQVLLNLISNAKEVLVEKRTKNRKIKLKSYRENDTIVIVHSDNGGGIESDIIEKIFEPYFTTKENFSGSGLGLYMSKIIIEKQFHGTIEVKNTLEGCSFTLVLPIEERGVKSGGYNKA